MICYYISDLLLIAHCVIYLCIFTHLEPQGLPSMNLALGEKQSSNNGIAVSGLIIDIIATKISPDGPY